MGARLVCLCGLLVIFEIGCSGPSVQSGKKVGDDIIVTIDNPDFFQSGVKLVPSETRWNGAMARDIDTSPNGVSVSNGDFVVRTSLGDGTAKSNGVSVFPSIGGEDLWARPAANGHFSSAEPPASVDLQAIGLRVGPTPLFAQLAQIEPNHTSPYFEALRIHLDPAVALVPVEAVVVFHDKDPDGHLGNGMDQQTRPQQLALWDHLSPADTSNIYDGNFGELTMATHIMRQYPRDSEGRYQVGTQKAPDTIWAACGVQFRLVNYFELQVPFRNVVPSVGGDPATQWPQGTFDDQPLEENADLVKCDPRRMDGPVLAIFMRRVSFPEAPETGRALASRNVIGVSLTENRGTDAIIAHELGHLSGLGDAKGTEKEASGKPMFDVMVQVGPGLHPTAAECAKIKPWADKFKPIFDKLPKGDH